MSQPVVMWKIPVSLSLMPCWQSRFQCVPSTPSPRPCFPLPPRLYLVIWGNMPGHIYALFAVAFVVASGSAAVAGRNEWQCFSIKVYWTRTRTVNMHRSDHSNHRARFIGKSKGISTAKTTLQKAEWEAESEREGGTGDIPCGTVSLLWR